MKEKIEDWAFGSNVFNSEVVSVDGHEGGLSNLVFLIETEESKSILKTPNKVAESHIKNEAGILEVLEREGFSGAPRKIYYGNPEEIGQEILVQSFVGEREAKFKELDEEQRTNFIKKLAEIHSTTPETYNQVFGEKEPSSIDIGEEVRQNFEKYGEKRFRFYREETQDFDPRMEELLHRQKEIVEEIERESGKTEHRLVHGDLSRNLRVEGKDAFLYDWEKGGIGIPRFELVFMFAHNDYSQEEREKFLEEYQKFRNIPEVTERVASKWEKFMHINDLLWAAMMKERALNAGEDPSEYKEMFDQRLERLGKNTGKANCEDSETERRLKHYLENGELRMEKMYEAWKMKKEIKKQLRK